MSLTTLDLAQLSSITGGTDTRTRLLTDALNNRFADDGAVRFVGRPVFSPAGHGLQNARGKVDVNALWGGDTKRSFTAQVDVAHHRVTNLHTRTVDAE